jgi:hypothetical protein
MSFEGAACGETNMGKRCAFRFFVTSVKKRKRRLPHEENKGQRFKKECFRGSCLQERK